MGVEFRESRFFVWDLRCRAVTRAVVPPSSLVRRGLFFPCGGTDDDDDATAGAGVREDTSGANGREGDSPGIAGAPDSTGALVGVFDTIIIMEGGTFKTSPALIPVPMALLGL